MSNSTCPSEYKPVDPAPFYSNGSINFKAHDVGWIVSGFFTLIASGASFWLIWKHLTYYSCPQQQRHIVRMLFMVPVYAVVSLLSYVFYHEAIYYQTIRDCYEAVVITSFFYLLLQYVGDTPAEQHEVFRMVKLTKWFFPLGFWKYRPDGLHFLWIMKISILQYAVVRPVCTLVAVGLQYYGLYCLESWAPHFGHIYISIAISISVSVAMYCVIQFYLPIQTELKPYSPVLKFLAVKSVVFLTFWQDSFLSILVYSGAIKESQFMSAADIQVGINALLETFEMMLFAFLHIKAFTYLVYRPHDRTRVTKRFRALLDVLDFRDWYYQMRQSTRYMAAGSKGGEFSLVDDIRRQKYVHLEQALGRDRWLHLQLERDGGKERMPSFWKEGCEPGDGGDGGIGEVEKKYVDPESTSSELTSLLNKDEATCARMPRGNAAMQADYNPELDVDEDDGMLDNEKDEADVATRAGAKRREENRMYAFIPDAVVPTLPKVDVHSIRGASSVSEEKHPELASHHRAPRDQPHGARPFDAHSDEVGRSDGELDIFVPRKGGRARKEPGAGVGAFWRTFRERVSGSEVGPHTTASSSNAVAQPITHVAQTNDMLDSRSSRSRIRFTEIKAPRADAKDDPEAEIPSYNGFVVAGRQSLQQARAKQHGVQQAEQGPRQGARPTRPNDEERRAKRTSAPPTANTPHESSSSRRDVGRARHSLSALQSHTPLTNRGDDRYGPFGAARAALDSTHTPPPSNYPRSPARGLSKADAAEVSHRGAHAKIDRPGLAVGSVVTRREMAMAMSGEPHPRPASAVQTAQARMPAPPYVVGHHQAHAPSTAWPSRGIPASQMRPAFLPQEQSRQMYSPPMTTAARTHATRRRSADMPPRAAANSQTRRTPMAHDVEMREARDGFHFEYLD